MGQRLFRSTTPVVPITEDILIVPEQVEPVTEPVAPVVEEKSSEDNAKDKDKLQEVLKGILRDY